MPVSLEQIQLAHDPRYVRGVLDLKIRNGFGNYDKGIAESLSWTNGAMLSAARHALANGVGAVAPCSGFHHACYTRGGGYCTFNGLVIAGAALRDEGAIERFGVLDFDMHLGDGTSDILRLKRWHDHVVHYSPVHDYSRVELAEKFLRDIPVILEAFVDCQIVLYQAGVDPHIDDPLGGWLSTEQLLARDRLVFAGLHRLGIPVAWNLAGGYQTDPEGGIDVVLRLHDNSLRACAEVWLGEEESPDPQ